MNDTATTDPETAPTERHRAHGHCSHRHGHHWHHRADSADLTGPQRVVHRTGRGLGWLVFLAVRITFLMLLVTGFVLTWRWMLDVLG